jgi:hypothetical protein
MAEGFENLLVWQKSHELKLLIHRQVVRLLPPEEKWDLASQIRRMDEALTQEQFRYAGKLAKSGHLG